MPATIAAEGFQAEERFVTDLGPKLTRPLEAALILPAGGLDRAAAERLASCFCRAVVEALPIGALYL